MASVTVHIHGGDYDCSEAVRMCYRAVGVLPYGSYMWTGNEVELLTSNGFRLRSLEDPKVGDVLWRDGHTEMYLGKGMQGGARIDESGGITGPSQGDQTGGEVDRSPYRASSWEMLLRYEGDVTVGGIPAAIAAARVMDHLIDHDAHGYSQPNRKGDGTLEAVTITWDGEPTGGADALAIPADVEVTFPWGVNVRDSPSTLHGRVMARYDAGESVRLDGIVLADGYVWGTYVGATSGRRRYVALGTTELAQVVA